MLGMDGDPAIWQRGIQGDNIHSEFKDYRIEVEALQRDSIPRRISPWDRSSRA